MEAGDRMEAAHWMRRHLDVVRNIKTGRAGPSRDHVGTDGGVGAPPQMRSQMEQP